MLKVVEYLDVDLVVWTVLFEEFAKAVREIVALSKFEDRFVYLLAEPYYSLADEFRCPLARTYKPRSDVSGKICCCIFVNIE